MTSFKDLTKAICKKTPTLGFLLGQKYASCFPWANTGVSSSILLWLSPLICNSCSKVLTQQDKKKRSNVQFIFLLLLRLPWNLLSHQGESVESTPSCKPWLSMSEHAHHMNGWLSHARLCTQVSLEFCANYWSLLRAYHNYMNQNTSTRQSEFRKCGFHLFHVEGHCYIISLHKGIFIGSCSLRTFRAYPLEWDLQCTFVIRRYKTQWGVPLCQTKFSVNSWAENGCEEM